MSQKKYVVQYEIDKIRNFEKSKCTEIHKYTLA